MTALLAMLLIATIWLPFVGSQEVPEVLKTDGPQEAGWAALKIRTNEHGDSVVTRETSKNVTIYGSGSNEYTCADVKQGDPTNGIPRWVGYAREPLRVEDDALVWSEGTLREPYDPNKHYTGLYGGCHVAFFDELGVIAVYKELGTVYWNDEGQVVDYVNDYDE